MVRKRYNWSEGVSLEEHTGQKLKVLREYFFDYLFVRCQPPRRQFRLALVDGFAGGGRYNCGTSGSPLIFLEVLLDLIQHLNIQRKEQGFPSVSIECVQIVNDESREAIEHLKANIAPLLSEIQKKSSDLHIHIEYLNDKFESAYFKIKQYIDQGRFGNVIFNLDQYAYIDVKKSTINDIMKSYRSAEIFYTFGIESLTSFLQKSNPVHLENQLRHIGLTAQDLEPLSGAMSRKSWLGAAEKLVFDTFRDCAQFVSPFSIHNPKGWQYWLIHFANNYRARQVYNNILHKNSSAQAHYGRSGLHMLYFDPTQGSGELYLFNEEARKSSSEQLFEDIPRLVTTYGDTIEMQFFYETIYNMTPAHSDDIHEAMIRNPDIEVITSKGGERRKADKIKRDDVLKLRNQKTFFPMFFKGGTE